MTLTAADVICESPAPARGPGSAVLRGRAKALEQYPARSSPATWASSCQSVEEVLAAVVGPDEQQRVPRLRQNQQRRGLVRLLGWLSSFPGGSWQERWSASGAEQAGGVAWKWLPFAAEDIEAPGFSREQALTVAVASLICADVIRPSMSWLLTSKLSKLSRRMAQVRDPEGMAALHAAAAREVMLPEAKRTRVLHRAASILATKGGGVRDITVGDCVEQVEAMQRLQQGPNDKMLLYRLLRGLGVFGLDAPETMRVYRPGGQLSIQEMVDRLHIACGPFRELLVAYVTEHLAAGLDYSSVDNIVCNVGRVFWLDLETHHPGIDTLRLTTEVAAGWRQRLLSKTIRRRQADGSSVEVSVPREDPDVVLFAVRAFYLDIAQWAAEEPGRWAAWVAPCPIRRGELARRKHIRRVKARMDQRTRERLPVLPLFAQALDKRRQDAAELLSAAAVTPAGATFEHGGQQYRRPLPSKKKAAIRVCATNVVTGKRGDLTQAEQDAFWAWAIVEILRHTGIRLEELTELNHHALVQYQLPSSGEIVPLLQIAPSKTDQERLLLVSPELADVLAAVIQRVRGPNGVIPLVISYDCLERVHNPALPLLLQRWSGTEHAPMSRATITNILNRALHDVGLSDITGAPLSMTPHDFRRIWVTDAILNGLPPHIAQVVCGHGDINTTMGYKAVYPMEAIESHRAYLARRRAIRPSAEYRAPSDQEWEEFLAHFEKRKVALGTCGRAFATPCIHEHACIRCPMLWPDPAQRGRLTDIRDNLQARIAEAEREGWHGEVDGLTVSLTAAQTKLEQLDRAAERKPVVLGLPGVAIPGQTRAATTP